MTRDLLVDTLYHQRLDNIPKTILKGIIDRMRDYKITEVDNAQFKEWCCEGAYKLSWWAYNSEVVEEFASRVVKAVEKEKLV